MISLAALALSVVTLFYTWRKDRAQNRRWDALNLARFAVRDLDFFTWGQLSPSDYETTTFGYADPFVVAGAAPIGSPVKVPVAVAAYDKAGTYETGIIGITVSEVNGKILRRDRTLAEYDFVKYYRIVLALENVGATVAREVAVEVLVSARDGELAPPMKHVSDQCGPGEKLWVVVPFATPLTVAFPRDVVVSVVVTFLDSHDAHQVATHVFRFDPAVGTFRHARE